jgi:hypothetical protein
MNLGEYITGVINDQGRRRVWVAEQANKTTKHLLIG